MNRVVLISSRIFRAVVIVGALTFVVQLSGRPVSSQSGRTQDPTRKKVKPVPPDPLPRPRIETPRNEDGTIRINSDLVTVVTGISRRDGGSLVGLERDDFEVLEDGVVQDISNFGKVSDLPLSMVMLFDTSLSVISQLDFERRAAGRFLERVMRPQDRAALFSFATDVAVLQDFTNRVPLLLNALKQLRSKGATSLYDAIFLAAEYLKPAVGRHVIVIISDGGDTTSSKDLKQALAQAQLSDVVIYAIYTGDRMSSENLRDLAAERALANLTAETGGEAYYPASRGNGGESEERSLAELNEAFGRLADQLRTQYTLGFYSTNDARDGAFRKLSVRVKKPGFTARARLGYYASRR
ncbi:MAG: VWA domain-containing protein [Acidobacteriota bacterium]